MQTHDPRVTIRSPLAPLARLLPLLALAAAGCLGRSEASVRSEFDAYVAGANACTAASDCVIVAPGCPLGCQVSVRADRKAAVEAKAADLVSDYERGGRGCAYDCIGPVAPVCTDGRCAMVEASVSPPADGGQ